MAKTIMKSGTPSKTGLWASEVVSVAPGSVEVTAEMLELLGIVEVGCIIEEEALVVDVTDEAERDDVRA